MDEKKKRDANFTASDRALLLLITNKKKHLIENKKTDAVTWRQKDREWFKIEEEFNASSTGPARTAKQLKNKYESVKRDLKKRHSQHVAYTRGTGGGPYVPPPSPQTPEEKILSQTICYGIEGLSSQFDSDGLAGVSGLKYVSSMKEDELTSVELNWGEPNSTLLQSSKNFMLRPSVENNDEHNYSNIIISPIETHMEDEHHDVEPIAERLVTEEAPATPMVRDQSATRPWHSRRRPIINKKKCLSSAGAKFETLASKKEELVAVQKSMLQEQRAEQREEHKKRLTLLDLQIEEQQLKNEILKKQLNVQSDTTEI